MTSDEKCRKSFSDLLKSNRFAEKDTERSGCSYLLTLPEHQATESTHQIFSILRPLEYISALSLKKLSVNSEMT